jgi:uncharacterized protein (TIRG00374 family)
MKKFSLFLISFMIGLGLFVWVIKFVGWQEIKRSLLIFTGWQGLVIFILTLFLFLVINWKWREILKTEGIAISFLDLFKAYLAGFSVMYLFPTFLLGGEFLRGYILKKKYNISWSKGMASIFIDRILDWTTNLIIVFLGISFFLFNIGILPKKLFIILGLTFLFWAGGIVFFYTMAFRKESMAKFILSLVGYKNQNSKLLETEKETFNFFRPRNIHFWRILSITFFEELVILFRIFLLISFFGKRISFPFALSVSGFSYLSTMIPIPASLGVQDALQAFAFNSLGLGASLGTAFTLIIRAVEIVVALVGIGLALRFGIKLSGRILSQDEIKEIPE